MQRFQRSNFSVYDPFYCYTYYMIAFYTNRAERINQLFLQLDIITGGIDEVSSNTKPLIRHMRKLPKSVNEEEASLFDILCLLLASVIFVPIFQKISGGSPVLGYLTAGILIGPYGLYYSSCTWNKGNS
ncbi:hypothetical protein CsSME_00012766 [Camellia sinensis var. sinensis]